jgi:bacterioferritin-associated ferredoxin
MKKFVCFCHDITEEELLKAISQGYDNLETLKRYIGFGMGPCQGKTCITHVIRILSRSGKMKQMKTTVMRPPVDPVYMAVLAAGADNEG